ncbi:MAG: hypothetical protein CMC28_04120 [Flavobacteriaceae bacterium]|nr:hypothetical protein [Flavobacteriaceae bacterium]
MKKNHLIIGLIVFAILTRLIPHPPNFAPVTAIALFSAINFNNNLLKFFIPLISLIIFDLMIGFSLINIFVYLSFIVIVLVGNHFKKIKLKSILISSVVFFIISNFGVWIIGYPKTVNGIIMCYTAAIPFFINTILGDLFYSFLLKYTFNISLKLNIIKTNH